MRFAYYFETHWSCLLFTPLIASSTVMCDACPTVHGHTIDIGWLFWTASIEVLTS